MTFNRDEIFGMYDWYEYYKSDPVNFKVGERIHIIVGNGSEPYKQLIFVCRNVSDDELQTYIGHNVTGHTYALSVTSNSLILERNEIIADRHTYKKISNYVYFEYEKEVVI